MKTRDHRSWFAVLFPAIVLVAVRIGYADDLDLPKFEALTIDSEVKVGYGTAIGDVDGDGKPDILLADSKRFVWYRNPDWKRYLIVENLTKRDNVCIAARDINGDGKVEIAVGAAWNPGDTESSGSVHYLIPPKDRTQKWTPIKLHNEPVVHRMRWVRQDKDKFVLVVAPLHGRGNRGGQGAGVRLLAYEMPGDPRNAWKSTLLDDTLHITHNFDCGQWYAAPSGEANAEEVFYLGREGAMVIYRQSGKWRKKKLTDIKGGGEIRLGRLRAEMPFLATVEPWHGSSLVCYLYATTTLYVRPGSHKFVRRVVLDDSFNQGHAVATGDLLGTGSQQIVAGWRSRNRDGKVGVKLYYAIDLEAKTWKSIWIDDGKMACEDIRIGDLDGDGRLDIVAAGRSTHNLNIYWNRKR